MDGITYLKIALAFAGIGLLLKVAGPIASRWHKKLERDLQRMKRNARGHS